MYEVVAWEAPRNFLFLELPGVFRAEKRSYTYRSVSRNRFSKGFRRFLVAHD